MVKNKIKEFRKELNVTQLELAKSLRVTRHTIIAIENHRYNPSLELALRLSKYFDKPLEMIFSLEEEEKV
ncbi:helix-turn-helix transcriptional regulator [Alteribacillus bidgolensis]|uniref:Putative transcriptional regulator n=1 Tax=Alteribacillus bidgolensis TaxID=930129 RepID=A0A1G8NNM3_9BACI|nr:helix-turn-helix transcriptional regulator [Alteribacillus bidgolensis]SDI81765.1 putative transcriptional regulator [Alteribacillus bidgolensis]